eukprot:gene6628-7375_t
MVTPENANAGGGDGDDLKPTSSMLAKVSSVVFSPLSLPTASPMLPPPPPLPPLPLPPRCCFGREGRRTCVWSRRRRRRHCR